MEKTVSDSTLELIKGWEGCHLTAYRCTSNVLTIGYGHTAGVYEGMTITQAQADAFLQEDLKKFASYVNNKTYVPITDSLNINQKEALISFAYNCGAGNLQKLCKNRTAAQIAENMVKYNKSGGKVLEPLKKRREKEQELFNTPVIETASSGWKKDVYNRWTYTENGQIVKNDWRQIDGKWYRFDLTGIMQTGWIEEGPHWYYLKPDGSMAENELLTISSEAYGDELYAFGNDGRMLATNTRGALE